MKAGPWTHLSEPQSDFILRMDWRVSKNGNSRVFIHAEEAGNLWETGYKVQI